jgi:YidC/Oxa1 family membrane protein insertase
VLTKPLHSLMLFFNGHIHNIGLSILAITVVIKLLTFPLVYTSYRSFAKLRDLSPKMKDIQTRFAEDKARQQQEMIKLYQTEKINPVAGCIPILLQMPIFFALFKVLSISIELRHAPFFGWVNDLSSRDPTTIFNLFGLLPFDPAAVPLIGGVISTGFLAIGIWPILYGASFALLQKMQPSNVTDPMQAKIFALMPWMFCFIFAGFSSGLVIYYTWSNLLTIVQQYAIAKSMKSSNPIDEFFAKLSKGKAKT